ncbi:MAG: hypothetical protein QXF12_02550 [Candidatus Aenigmatarchaeota archaeon]
MALNLVVGNIYNFNVYPNTVLGFRFLGYKLSSIMDFNTANKFANILNLHNIIYPYLPSGTPSNYMNYTYYMFVKNDRRVVVADAWIIPSSIEVTNEIETLIKLKNVNSTMLNVITEQLRVLGVSFELL